MDTEHNSLFCCDSAACEVIRDRHKTNFAMNSCSDQLELQGREDGR